MECRNITDHRSCRPLRLQGRGEMLSPPAQLNFIHQEVGKQSNITITDIASYCFPVAQHQFSQFASQLMKGRLSRPYLDAAQLFICASPETQRAIFSPRPLSGSQL